jgi:hypothetical protein
MFDSKLRQGSPDLRQARAIHGSIGPGSMKEMAAAIGVKASKQAFFSNDRLQAGEDRHRSLLLAEKGLIDLSGRIIHKRNQILFPAQPRNPLMRAAVGMNKHSRQGPPRTFLPVLLAAASLGHKPAVMCALTLGGSLYRIKSQ